jgi:hypothetical protein
MKIELLSGARGEFSGAVSSFNSILTNRSPFRVTWEVGSDSILIAAVMHLLSELTHSRNRIMEEPPR